MGQWWWYLTRAAGIVATLLAVGSLVLGLCFSARNMGVHRRPAWWLDLHNHLGGLALVFTGAHVLASVLDPGSGVGAVQAIIPATDDSARWAITWGVLATYGFVVAVLTSWPKRRFTRRVWRVVHLTSVGAVALGGLHAIQLGTDAGREAFELGAAGAALVAVYAVSVRVIAVLTRTRLR